MSTFETRHSESTSRLLTTTQEHMPSSSKSNQKSTKVENRLDILQYIEWLKSLVRDPNYDPWKYDKLFLKLFLTFFRYSIPMDKDRATDGRRLRYRYGVAKHIPEKAIEKSLDIFECTVLEMLIALSEKCVANITYGIDGLDKPNDIFWMFIENLDLNEQDDANFVEGYVEKALDIFLDRCYGSCGYGGNIISIKNLDRSKDLCRIDIYKQMQLFVASVRDWYGGVDSMGI